MIQWGSTTLSLVGWAADPRRPEESRAQRLAAIRHLVEGYGLQALELTLDVAAVYPHVFDAGFYASVGDLQQRLGFTCTAHLPFLWVDASSLNEPIRAASAACLRQTVELAGAVEVRTYVLHLWGFTTTQIALQLQHPAQRQAISTLRQRLTLRHKSFVTEKQLSMIFVLPNSLRRLSGNFNRLIVNVSSKPSSRL